MDEERNIKKPVGLNAVEAAKGINTWKNRLIHTNASVIHSMHKHAVEFPRLSGDMEACHSCELGKAKKVVKF